VLGKSCISEEDLDLLIVCDTPEEVVEAVQGWYTKQKLVGKKALPKYLSEGKS
jgi:predicted Rossmann-fold nucleotide-binding protein